MRPLSIIWILLIGSIFSCNENNLINEGNFCSDYPDWKTSEFVLPYPVGTSYTLVQGNCSSASDEWNSHQVNTAWQYAYDFLMPIGTIITAPRSGIVVFVRENFTDADKELEKGNILVIEHDDGTFSGYGHLTHNGALAEVNQQIEKGDTIALSGNSGLSWVPHLHFQVGPCIELQNCGSLPTTFNNTTPNPNGLQRGISYEALPY